MKITNTKFQKYKARVGTDSKLSQYEIVKKKVDESNHTPAVLGIICMPALYTREWGQLQYMLLGFWLLILFLCQVQNLRYKKILKLFESQIPRSFDELEKVVEIED